MKITVIGTGYVGLVTGASFAQMGVDVTCVDVDRTKIEMLRRGEIPIYEPGLDDLVVNNIAAGRLHFTTSLDDSLCGAEAVFIAVGTPQRSDGSADTSYIEQVAHQIGRIMKDYVVLVVKSTVPVGTWRKVKAIVRQELDDRGARIDFDLVSNPEFLKEGTAIKDFMSPDRVVIGVESSRARELMEKLYKPFLLNNFRVIFMDVSSAEMTKYAANAMLATRISFMNEMASLCELVGADVEMVRKGIGSDNRIGMKFLYPGIGYGGSCFPKDVRALAATARELGGRMIIIEAVDEVNNAQKLKLFDKLLGHFGATATAGSLAGRRIALWGLAFKPETDDIREAPAMALIHRILEMGAAVSAYDPVAMPETRKALGDRITLAGDMYDALREADALCVVTEWKQFRLPDWSTVKAAMKGRAVFDGRNIYERDELEGLGFDYYRIG